MLCGHYNRDTVIINLVKRDIREALINICMCSDFSSLKGSLMNFTDLSAR